MIVLFVILLCIQLANSHHEGAPVDACRSMIPEHDVSLSKCQPKYLIQADKLVFGPNDAVRITVRGTTIEDRFKGILLTAKNPTNQQILGTWSLQDSSLQTLACDKVANTAVTHSSANEKTQIEAVWHAPDRVTVQSVIIKATIVKSYDEIYVDCFNLTLTPDSRALSAPSVPSEQPKVISTEAKTKVSWTYADSLLTVTMTTESVSLNEWRSIGFSLDEEMGDEYVFICQVSAAGNTLLRRMHTKLGKRPPSASNEEVTVIDTSFEDGVLMCKFSFDVDAEQAQDEPAPIATEKNYHILFAAGVLRSEQQIAKHTLHMVTPKTYQIQTDETIDFDDLMTTTTTTTVTITSGSTNDSITTTSSALSTATTSMASEPRLDVRWTYANGVTSVKMQVKNLRASQWIALGLSLDDMMGDDHVFSCARLADDRVLLRRMINPGGHARPTLANDAVDFNITRQAIENGVISCDFTLSNFVGGKRMKRQTKVFDLLPTTAYYPLIATGNLDQANNMMRHSSTGRRALSTAVFLNRQETIGDSFDPDGVDQTKLMKAHGCIMIFTWLILVSTGVLVARYFKLCWSDRKICGKAVWFAIHRALMSSAAILTLIAFVLILVYKKGQWTSKLNQREFAHSIVGILVISFAVIQPFMAIFRCNPDDEYRFIFNYAHATVGISAFLLSIVAIFLAMFFSQFEFQVKNEWAILVVWSCWIPIIFIIFELIEIRSRRKATDTNDPDSYNLDQYNQYETDKVDSKAPVRHEQQQRIKVTFLLLHVVVALGLALALIILVGQS